MDFSVSGFIGKMKTRIPVTEGHWWRSHAKFLAPTQHAVPACCIFPFGALKCLAVVMLCSPAAVQAESWRASPWCDFYWASWQGGVRSQLEPWAPWQLHSCAPLHFLPGSGKLGLVCVLTGLTAGADPRLFPVGKLGLGILSAVDVQVWLLRQLFAGGPEL